MECVTYQIKYELFFFSIWKLNGHMDFKQRKKNQPGIFD